MPETDGGRAWHHAFAADGAMLPVRLQRLAHSVSERSALLDSPHLNTRQRMPASDVVLHVLRSC